MDVIAQPFLFLLHQLYEVTGNLGWAIIVLTLLIRAATVPLTLPSLKSQRRMRALQPELKKLRAQHEGNAAAFGQAQMVLFKEHQINPLAGCLPTLVQIGILFVLYHVLREFIGEGQQGLIENVNFYGLDLTVPDRTFVVPILAAGLQLLLSVMLLPGLESHDIYPEKSDSKEIREANKQETQQQDMAAMMQKQMMLVFPVMTGIMAATFPAGLGVYWVVSTAFSLVQQYFISGWGGLARFLPESIRKIGPQPEVIGHSHVSRAETIQKISQKGQGSSDDFAAAFAKIATGKSSSKPRETVEEAVIVPETRKPANRKTKPSRKKQRSKKRRK